MNAIALAILLKCRFYNSFHGCYIHVQILGYIGKTNSALVKDLELAGHPDKSVEIPPTFGKC